MDQKEFISCKISTDMSLVDYIVKSILSLEVEMVLKVLAALFLLLESIIVVVALAKYKSERDSAMHQSAAQTIHRMVPFPMNWLFHLLSVLSIVILLS